MAFVNPNILQKIFGGAQQLGQTLGSAPQAQQQQLHQALMGAGAGMSQAAARPGANFGQALGGGAQGMMQGQQNAQQMQLNQMQMAQAQREMERQERISKIMGDILQPRRPDFASQVATGPVQQPQVGPAQTAPYQQEANVQATRFAGPPDAQRWEALFPELKANVIRTESGGRQFGDDGQTLTSSAGAQGLMQIMPGTGPDAAELAGLPWDPERMANDPKYNEQLGTAYLNHLGGRYSGDPVLASAAYNWGMGRVDSHIDKVGDPRKGEISHEDWVRSIPVEEARNYAASVGLPLVQGGGQSQAQPAAQPQQAPQQQLNGYQQIQRGSGGQLNLPPQAAQLLSLMPPEKAASALWDLQTRTPADMPAEVRELMWAFDGDEEAARQAWHAQQQADAQGDQDQRDRKIRDYQELYGVDRNQATAMADGLIQPVYNEQLGRTVLIDSRDPNNPRVREVEIAPASQISEEEKPEETLFDIAQRGNIAGIVPSAADTLGRVTGQAGFLTEGQKQTAEDRQTVMLTNRSLVRALQDSPMYAQREREAIEREIGINPSAFDSQEGLLSRMRAVHGVLERRLAEAKRIEADPRMGDDIRRQAQKSARDIESYLNQMGDPPPEGGSGQADPEVDALIDRWAD